MMKQGLKCIICCVIGLWNLVGYAQQTPHYTLHIFNNYMINPAVTGSTKCWEAKAGYRTQWMGFESAPVTMFLSAHGRLNRNKSSSKASFEGLGAYVIKDQTGPMSKLGGHLSYAFHFAVSRKVTTSIGLSFGIMQYVVDAGDLKPLNPIDPAVTSSNSILPDANAGIWTYSDDFFIGLAARQLLPLTISGTEIRMIDHLYFTAGYRFLVNRTVSIIPSAHARMGLITPLQIDVAIRVDWGNRFWIGLAYRKIDAVAGLVGFNISPLFKLGYAYDYTLSKIQGYSSNTHEIILGFQPKCNRGSSHKICPAYL